MDGTVYSAMTFELVDGRIQSIYNVRNPDKLRQIGKELSLAP
jgi:hypothetical protein